ncbi:MAG TPA: hypothetical protein VH858_19135 [Hyphomicrobiales bacterium]|jgi:hypothetical protein
MGALLEDVFGLDRSRNPLSYVVRDIETNFVKALSNRKYIALVLHGASKQGKTSLLRHALNNSEIISLEGSVGDTTESLYREILAQCGVTQQTETNKTSAAGGISFGWFHSKIGREGSVSYEPIAVDLASPASIARIANNSTKKRIIVLDNYHYLELEAQHKFSTAIRAFEKFGFKFIIIGTWMNSGYMQNFNKELLGTVKEFEFSAWNSQDLQKVLETGAKHLRITFSPRVAQSLIRRSVNNIALLQDLTKNYLEKLNTEREIFFKDEELTDTGKVADAASEIEKEMRDDVTQYLRVVCDIGKNNAIAGGRSRSYWIVRAFLGGNENEITNGMAAENLLERTNALIDLICREQKVKVTKIRPQEFYSLLRSTWSSEQQKAIKSGVLIFDEFTRSIMVGDSYTKFVLRTGARHQIKEIL